MGIQASSKYKNIPIEYKGRRFDSKKEAEHAGFLDMLRKAKEPSQCVKAIEYQYRIPIVVNGIQCAVYVADFYVLFQDGHKEIHEVKGFKTDVYKIKKKLVEAIYGEKIIEF